MMGFRKHAKLLTMGRFALGRASGSLVLFGIAALTLGSIQAADLSKAEELYRHTDFEASLKQLDKHSTDGATNFLIGRDYFMLVDFKKATTYLQMAVARTRERRVPRLAGKSIW